MPMIPAFCDSCGSAFSSGIFVKNCTNVSLTGNKSGPCPKCGSMGSVVDGVFNATHDVLEIVSAPDWTIRRLRELAKTLKEIRDSNASPVEKAGMIRDEAPELQSVADSLPKTRIELYAFITMFLFARSIILSDCSDDDSEAVDRPDFQYVVNKAAEDIQNI